MFDKGIEDLTDDAEAATYTSARSVGQGQSHRRWHSRCHRSRCGLLYFQVVTWGDVARVAFNSLQQNGGTDKATPNLMRKTRDLRLVVRRCWPALKMYGPRYSEEQGWGEYKLRRW